MNKIVTLLFLMSFMASAQKDSIFTLDQKIEGWRLEPTFNSKRATPYSIYGDKRFESRIIEGGYKYFSLKGLNYSKKKYGISKNDTTILPMIFSELQYDRNKGNENIILGFVDNVGLYNVETESWNIPIIYESLKELEEGLYRAKLKGKYGVIDENNNILIPFEWTYLDIFPGLDYLLVSKDDIRVKHYGLLSIKSKKVTIPCEHSKIINLGENCFFVNTGKEVRVVNGKNQNYFKSTYDTIIKADYNYSNLIVKKEGLWGVIDLQENILLPFEYKEVVCHNSYLGTYFATNEVDKMGIINISGKVIAPFSYDNYIGTRGKIIKTKIDEKYGALYLNSDTSSFILLPCIYDDLTFSSTYIIVQSESKFGVFNSESHEIVPMLYDEIIPIYQVYSGVIFVCKMKKKYFVFNSKGEKLGDDGYLNIEPIERLNTENNKYYKFQDKNKKYGIIDKSGIILIEAIFDDIVDDINDLIIVGIDGEYGLLNISSKKLVVQLNFDKIIFNNEIFIGMKDNKYYILFQGSNGYMIEHSIKE